MRRIVVVALLAFLAGAGTYRLATKTIPQDFLRAAGQPKAPANPYYEVRRGQFAITKPPPSPVVMLGDSIIEQGLWSELTGCPNIINRGIGSDTTAGVLNRIDEIIALNPKRVYLMIGVNDAVKDFDTNSSSENIKSTLRILAEHKIETVRFATLPVSGDRNERISALNTSVADKPTTVGIEPADLSFDGIHLRASGYQKLASRVSC